MSGILLEVLRCAPGMPVELPLLDPSPELLDDDVQLALYLCYELHYGELEGVDDRWEWDPGLLAFRAVLERAFETSLYEAVPPPQSTPPAEVVGTALHALVAADESARLSCFVELRATRDQLRELMVHRSAYRLKQAAPHSWAIARLSGAAKAALVEVRTGEYGGGRAERMHVARFAKAMEAVGLDPRDGAYLQQLPGITLATVNLTSLCGLRSRRRPPACTLYFTLNW